MLANTAWNLAGLGVPILAAIVAMPLLIDGLGDARFGILALGWMVTGYFALFDFGVGRATTRSMAVLRSENALPAHAAVFWNSLYVHAILALVGGLLFAAAVPWMVDIAFAIPTALRNEAGSAFYWLAFSVPALVLSSALRGPLEAEQRFDLVNAVKMPISALNYLAPVLALQFTERIDAVIAVIAITRWLAMLAFGLQCARAVALIPRQRKLHRQTAFKLLADGGWLTVTSIAVPVIMMLDRGLISRLLSLESVTYYVVPYEVVTKMWILSASLLGAAYPMMSAAKGIELQRLCSQSTRWLLVTATPATMLAILFAEDILRLWVGPRIALHGTPILQCLALGVWINVLAQVPLTALQASGKSRIVGIVQLCELPLYAGLAWMLIDTLGVTGAAIAWSIRAAIEWLAFGLLLHKTEPDTDRWPGTPLRRLALLGIALGASWALTAVTMSSLKFGLSFALLAAMSWWQWNTLLTAGERAALHERLRRKATPP